MEQVNHNFIRALMCSVCLPRQALENPEKTIHVSGVCAGCGSQLEQDITEHQDQFKCSCGNVYKVSRPSNVRIIWPKPLPTASEKDEQEAQNTLH